MPLFDGLPGAVLASTITSDGGGVFTASFVPNIAGDIAITLQVYGRGLQLYTFRLNLRHFGAYTRQLLSST
jgi:hypothetical protein